ncbi:MAG: hypothetical protein LBP27_02840 [Treponema sp.]|jgi:hypothetical protein|nr:hypothetical protein [Treponema sp.]
MKTGFCVFRAGALPSGQSRRPAAGLLVLPLAVLALSSCFGVSLDISVKNDGSGRMNLEYRFSRQLESLGRLDGNGRWNIIPTGEADFKRSLARSADLDLVSFSAKEEDGDIVNRAEIEFKTSAALVSFLDAGGRRAAAGEEGAKKKLRLVLHEGTGNADPELLSLLKENSGNREVSVSLSAPGEASLALVNLAGEKIEAPPGARLTARGKKVSFAMNTGDLLGFPGGIILEILF